MKPHSTYAFVPGFFYSLHPTFKDLCTWSGALDVPSVIEQSSHVWLAQYVFSHFMGHFSCFWFGIMIKVQVFIWAYTCIFYLFRYNIWEYSLLGDTGNICLIFIRNCLRIFQRNFTILHSHPL